MAVRTAASAPEQSMDTSTGPPMAVPHVVLQRRAVGVERSSAEGLGDVEPILP